MLGVDLEPLSQLSDQLDCREPKLHGRVSWQRVDEVENLRTHLFLSGIQVASQHSQHEENALNVLGNEQWTA